MDNISTNKWPLVLASASPRRRELLRLCQIPFDVVEANVNEEDIIEETLAKNNECNKIEAMIKATLSLAKAKAQDVAKVIKQPSVVIGADTVVLLEERVLGKPKSKEEAQEMLQSLVGKKHTVITGVAIHSPKDLYEIQSLAEVHFHKEGPWTQRLIRDYVHSLSPMDKAGAYGIQDMGALFVEKIVGDYYTIMGFPVALVWQKLMEIYSCKA